MTTVLANYDEFSSHLDSLGLFHMDMGLERIEMVLDKLELQRPPFAVVQVVGTNGKGSTATALAGIAAAHGLKAGLCTSPHFVSPRERIQVFTRETVAAGAAGMFSREEWVEFANHVLQAAEPIELTYFELLTAMALVGFAKAGVDVAVMEAGLGGTYDATTALECEMVLFTRLGMDHQSVLGDTLEKIARDKAGALRPGMTAVSGPQRPAAMAVLNRRAAGLNTELLEAHKIIPDSTGHPVPHIDRNLRLAMAAWKLLANKWDKPEGLPDLPLLAPPGRAQQIAPSTEHNQPALLVDGAHNEDGFQALADFLDASLTSPSGFIFSMLEDKDMGTILPMVRGLTHQTIHVVPIQNNPRSMDPEVLAKRLGGNVLACESLDNALELVSKGWTEEKGPVLICGSLYLLADLFALRPDCLTYAMWSPGK